MRKKFEPPVFGDGKVRRRRKFLRRLDIKPGSEESVVGVDTTSSPYTVDHSNSGTPAGYPQQQQYYSHISPHSQDQQQPPPYIASPPPSSVS